MDTLIDHFGVQVIHGWGMTDMSPLGTTGGLLAKHRRLPVAQQRAILQKQGHAIYGVDMKIVDDDGHELDWDGVTSGHLMVKGPWVIARYFRDEGGDPLRDGWFPTGDVATIDADGFMQITDRSKDVIKSGGEWIGSIDIENIAMAHPAVLQAACIAMPHPKWDERPLLLVVARPGQQIGREEMLRWFEGRIAKFWMPDEVVFVASLPLGGTGKVQKNKLREQFKDYQAPGT
jgi:acyl-CoA synthetase (AMP-forming)/AMP-acid ligase II